MFIWIAVSNARLLNRTTTQQQRNRQESEKVNPAVAAKSSAMALCLTGETMYVSIFSIMNRFMSLWHPKYMDKMEKALEGVVLPVKGFISS